jgi:hypothetical protein
LYAHWHLLEAEIRDTSEQIYFAEACFVQMSKTHLTIPTEVEVSFPAGFLEDYIFNFIFTTFTTCIKISASKALYVARHRQKR